MTTKQTSQYTATGGHAVSADNSLIEPMARALWIGTQGNIAVEGPDGTTVTYTNVVGLLNVQAVRILSTGTTATGIVAMH